MTQKDLLFGTGDKERDCCWSKIWGVVEFWKCLLPWWCWLNSSACRRECGRRNANKLSLFGPHTKWKGNELHRNNLNCVNADFSSSNRITVVDDRAQSRVHPCTAKLSPFQDVEDIEFEDICDNDAPDLDITTLRAIAAFWSGSDFFEENVPTDIILTVINSITSQTITPA